MTADAGGFDLRRRPQGPNLFSNWISVCLTGSTTYKYAASSLAGNTEEDGTRSLILAGDFSLVPAENLELRFSLRRQVTRTDLDNFGGAYGDDPNSTQDSRSLFLRTELRSLHLGNAWEQRLSLSFVGHGRDYENGPDSLHPQDSERGEFRGRRWKLDWQHNLRVRDTNTMTLGLEFENESGESAYVSESAWGPYESLFPRRSARMFGFYIQDRIAVGRSLFASAGVRLDVHSLAGRALTFRIAPAYVIPGTGTKMRATLGTGFKAPSLYQLFAPDTAWGPVGNEGLEPESSTAWDFGLEQPFLGDRLRLEAAVFLNSFRNLIQFDFLSGFVNIGRAEAKGFELRARARPLEELLLQVGYSRVEAVDLETETPLLRRPKNILFASAAFRISSRADLFLSLAHVGERADVEFTGVLSVPVTLKPYNLLNAILTLTALGDLEFYVKLENILNERYEILRGYGTAGRSFFAGLSLSIH